MDMMLREPVAEDRAADLLDRYRALKAANPKLRARDAAEQLGVGEGELLAARIGERGDGDDARVVRLDASGLDEGWGGVIRMLPALGEVMTITRNAWAVHEKTGRFQKITINPGHGLVLDREIDLRLFLNRWHFGFAVRERVLSGVRDSLQVFDLDGTAVHKVYLTGASDRDAFDRLVDGLAAADQRPGLDTVAYPPPAADRPDGEIDLGGLRRHWERLQDTHDFFALLRDFGAGRHQAFRMIGDDLAAPVAPDSLERTLRLAADRAVPIMVFVGNAGCIQIHTGQVARIEPAGPWINVLDPRFNLHVRQDRVGSAWVVRKPTRDGVVTSLELFDRDRRPMLQLFGERKPGRTELDSWRALLAELQPLGTQAVAGAA